MSVVEERNHIYARVWKAIAKLDIDKSALSEEDLEVLVETVIDSVLLEVDKELGEELFEDQHEDKEIYQGGMGEKEQILWKGRPFLSISTEYLITSERIRIISGLLGKNREDIELIRIQDIDQDQTLRERILSIGDITVQSHDQSHPKVVLNDIRNPQEVHEILRRAVIAARKDHGLLFREEM